MRHDASLSEQAASAGARLGGLRTLHVLLAVQSVVVVLVAINRKGHLTTGYVSGNEFLRWVDLLNLLVLPVASLLASVLLKRWLEARVPHVEGWRGARGLLALDLTFMVGVYVLAASYGTHEVTNYLNQRFCLDDPSRLCEIVAFNDDSFSHWLLFSGFVAVNAVLLALQALTEDVEAAARWDLMLIAANALFIAAGIFANLALEETGFDLAVVALLFVIAVLCWRRGGARPLFVYYSVAYGVGLAATTGYFAFS
jgi:hypothetical protein